MRLPPLLALLLCSAVQGQIVVTPEKPKLGEKIVVSGVSANATWTVPEGAELLPHNGGWILFPGKAGSLSVTARVPAVYVEIEAIDSRDKGNPDDRSKWTTKIVKVLTQEEKVHTATIVVAGHGPQPPPDVVVPPKPAPSGKRHVVLIRETADTTDELARITTGLRVGPQAKWFLDNGHTLNIEDDDQLPAELKAKLGSLPPLPALFVIDAATGAVIYADQLHATSAAQVIDLVKQAG